MLLCKQYSFLESDILVAQMMVQMQMCDAAKDYFKYCFKARQSETDYLSFHDLATWLDCSVVLSQMYSLYKGTLGLMTM